jgi:phospholipid/cholesterol/gamma-HCH transport system substrate-binding protein
MRYLALAASAPGAPELADGAHIPLSMTRPALDLSDVFNGFAPLFNTLSPAEINKLSNNLALTLQGSGPALTALLTELARVTSGFAQQDKVVGALVADLGRTLEHLSGEGPAIATLIARSRTLVRNVNRHSGLIFSTLGVAAQVSTRLEHLVAALAPLFPGLVASFNAVAAAFISARKEVTSTLTALPSFLGSLGHVFDWGSGLNIYACSARLQLPGAGVVPVPQPRQQSAVCR